jgi:hypothetical protein
LFCSLAIDRCALADFSCVSLTGSTSHALATTLIFFAFGDDQSRHLTRAGQLALHFSAHEVSVIIAITPLDASTTTIQINLLFMPW